VAGVEGKLGAATGEVVLVTVGATEEDGMEIVVIEGAEGAGRTAGCRPHRWR